MNILEILVVIELLALVWYIQTMKEPVEEDSSS